MSHRAPAFLQYLTNAEHLTPNIFQYSTLIHFNALASPKETDHVAPPLLPPSLPKKEFAK